ncbi:MAG: hypothetical protein F6K39_13955 [Okeania sp. SIO3B3]|nr:hypothetical protein [Okeania sp. SIO3B3]
MENLQRKQVEQVLEYINNYWHSLQREANKQEKKGGTLLNLPYPYLVPSHQGMFQEMY